MQVEHLDALKHLQTQDPTQCKIIERLAAHYHVDVADIAKSLDISRTTLYYHIRKMKVSLKKQGW